jgi:hypothetical protein
MPNGDGPPVPYSLENYPYVREILDSRAKKNWVMKGAQVGLTEAGITRSLFEIDHHKRDVLYYLPTGVVAKRMSLTRFHAAIALSPYLKQAVTQNSVELKQIGHASLHILGAGSDTNLKSTSAGRLFMDELDEWSERQIYLAEERLSGQAGDNKIVWGMSTPKYPNMGIHKQYLQSTQEHYFFPCPHCGAEIELLWPDSVEIVGEAVDDTRVNGSYLKCKECAGKLDHDTKPDWLGQGKWVPTNPDADPTLSRGFWLSQLYSPTVTAAELVISYLRGLGDLAARREFHNSKLGLPFLDDCFQVNDTHLDDAIGGYALANVIPKTTADGLFTLGIDQGGAFHHWVVVQWTLHADRLGDPGDRHDGKVIGIGKVLQDDWEGLHNLMRMYQVRMAVCDYFPEPTNARQFARLFPGFVWLCQYVTGTVGRDIRLSEDEYGASVVKADKVGWLTKSLGRVMTGGLALPLDTPMEFRQHIKSPVRTVKMIDGKAEARFVESGADHWAHALNYAEIALKIYDPSPHMTDAIQ